MRGWWNGIHERLKISWSHDLAGSTPALRTNKISPKLGAYFVMQWFSIQYSVFKMRDYLLTTIDS